MIDYILDKIKKTEIKNDPFEHMFINNIFPDKYFEELLKNLPKKNDYIAINKTGAVKSGYSAERYVFNLNHDSIFLASAIILSLFKEYLSSIYCSLPTPAGNSSATAKHFNLVAKAF